MKLFSISCRCVLFKNTINIQYHEKIYSDDIILFVIKAYITLVDSGFTLLSDLTLNYYATFTYSSFTVSIVTGFYIEL